MSLKTILFSIFLLILSASSIYFSVKINSLTGVVENIQKEQMSVRNNAPIPPDPAYGTVEVKAPQQRDITGQIVSFSGNTMTIKVVPMNSTTPSNQSERTVTVNIDDQTKFVMITQEDINAIQKAMKDLRNTPADQRSAMKSPPPIDIHEVGRDAFVAGKRVMVRSLDGIIPEATTITADSVTLLPEMPSVPAGQ